MTLPLNGIQVVEVSSFVAAPLCGMTLAQLGAEVIRVDPIGGAADYRRWPLAVKDERELRGFTARLEELDIRTLFVIGGDDVAIGDFNEASEILEALEGFAHGITRIGVGCYPEGHPHIDDESLLECLLRKQRYADYMLSQTVFRPGGITAVAAAGARGRHHPAPAGRGGRTDEHPQAGAVVAEDRCRGITAISHQAARLGRKPH